MNEELGVSRGLLTGNKEIHDLKRNQISILVKRISGSFAAPGYNFRAIWGAANG